MKENKDIYESEVIVFENRDLYDSFLGYEAFNKVRYTLTEGKNNTYIEDTQLRYSNATFIFSFDVANEESLHLIGEHLKAFKHENGRRVLLLGLNKGEGRVIPEQIYKFAGDHKIEYKEINITNTNDTFKYECEVNKQVNRFLVQKSLKNIGESNECDFKENIGEPNEYDFNRLKKAMVKWSIYHFYHDNKESFKDQHVSGKIKKRLDELNKERKKGKGAFVTLIQVVGDALHTYKDSTDITELQKFIQSNFSLNKKCEFSIEKNPSPYEQKSESDLSTVLLMTKKWAKNNTQASPAAKAFGEIPRPVFCQILTEAGDFRWANDINKKKYPSHTIEWQNKVLEPCPLAEGTVCLLMNSFSRLVPTNNEGCFLGIKIEDGKPRYVEFYCITDLYESREPGATNNKAFYFREVSSLQKNSSPCPKDNYDTYFLSQIVEEEKTVGRYKASSRECLKQHGNRLSFNPKSEKITEEQKTILHDR